MIVLIDTAERHLPLELKAHAVHNYRARLLNTGHKLPGLCLPFKGFNAIVFTFSACHCPWFAQEKLRGFHGLCHIRSKVLRAASPQPLLHGGSQPYS